MSVTVLVCTTVVITVLAICTAEPIDFKPCDPKQTNIKGVDISPCPTQPCSFSTGTNATVKVTFDAPLDASNLTSEIFGIIANIPVKFPMPNSNGCRDSGLSCPITKGNDYEYVQHLAVLPSYPKIKLVVKWDLILKSTPNDDKQYEFCFVFPMSIKE